MGRRPVSDGVEITKGIPSEVLKLVHCKLTNVRGRHLRRDAFREGTLSSFAVDFHAPPPPVPLPPACALQSPEIPEVKLHLCRAQERTECSDLGAQSTSPVHAVRQSIVGNMGCAAMHASPCKLPSQVLARTIKCWTMTISHVQWARHFKLLWPRPCMPAYIGLRMIEVHPSGHQMLQPCRDP